MYRFCCDFRYLNSQSQHFRYAIPDLQEYNYISSIDLSYGFFQMGIAPESSRYTAFNTCFGTYKFLRLPMDKVLHGLTFRSALCYLDDVIICSDTFDAHMKDLAELWTIWNGWPLNAHLPSKSVCSFAQQKYTFLGHVISKDGPSAPPDRFEAIQRYPVPFSVSVPFSRDVRMVSKVYP